MESLELNTLSSKLQSLIAKVRGQKAQGLPSSHWFVYALSSSQHAIINIKEASGIFSLDKILVSDPTEKTDSLSIKRNLSLLQPGGSPRTKLGVSSAISGQGVITRLIQMPKMSIENLKSSLTYEMDKYIPFKASDVIWDVVSMGEFSKNKNGDQEMAPILLVAAKKEDVLPWVETLTGAGVQVNCLDLDCLAVFNSLCFLQPEAVKGALGILVLGKDLTHFVVVSNGKPHFIRDISFGLSDVVKRLKRKLDFNEQSAAQVLQDLSESKEPPEVLKQTLEEIFSSLSGDLKISIDYYLEQISGAQPISKIYVAGDLTENWFIQLLSAQTGVASSAIDVFEKLTIGFEVDPAMVRKLTAVLPIALGVAVKDYDKN